jgi:hypothetical protein
MSFARIARELNESDLASDAFKLSYNISSKVAAAIINNDNFIEQAA